MSLRIRGPEPGRLETYQVRGAGEPLEVVSFELLAWDSEVLGLKCARIKSFEAVPGAHRMTLNYSGLVESFVQLGLEYVTVRCVLPNWPRVQRLEAAGFRLVDGILEFSKDDFTAEPLPPADPYTFRLATASDARIVGELSVQTFTQSRFHNDPLLNQTQRDRVHREWAMNACTGKGTMDTVAWLAMADDRLAGFITCEVAATVGTIGLIGVVKADVGQGLGKALVSQASRWFREQQCTLQKVRTQSDNLAAIGLYMHKGFRPVANYLTLRWSSQRTGP